MSRQAVLDGRPALGRLVDRLDRHLAESFPEHFSEGATRPSLPPKRRKVIHDSLWGTNPFTLWELVLLDSPLLQRLRAIKQTGLASLVYPGASHSRLEHTLGVTTVAGRVFDAIAERNGDDLSNIAKATGATDAEHFRRQCRQDLRLAAILHDTGHSLFSHASEAAYGETALMQGAIEELRSVTGRSKGAGEVLSFCFALAPGVERLLGRVEAPPGQPRPELWRAALILVGKSAHPYTQFLGDIISSALDADKLDYLLRDAEAAGLPMRYDVDRYLDGATLDKKIISVAAADGPPAPLYRSLSGLEPTAAGNGRDYPYFDAYRLALPRRAINAVEQVVIAKFMLFSYIYHHPKVRAAEGLAARMLRRFAGALQQEHASDEDVVARFMGMEDCAIAGPALADSADRYVNDYSRRIRQRLLPREVYRISSALSTHAEKGIVEDFLAALQDAGRGPQKRRDLELAVGEEILSLRAGFAPDAERALLGAGAWVDVPRPPKFEDLREVLAGDADASEPSLGLLPLGPWTQAYTHYRYFVRIFAFSEHVDLVAAAARSAMERVVGVRGDAFFKRLRRTRNA